MAKDKSLSKEERKAAKKAAKADSTLVESAGVSKSKSDKADKKEKKEKKEKKAKLAEKLLEAQASSEDDDDNKQVHKNGSNVGKGGEVVSDEEMEVDTKGSTRLIGALVPFANPLADEKVAKKVFRGVKKAAANRTLKRGVKEVVKSLRKSQSGPGESVPIGIVVLAADISPMDVISHIPVLCEDHNIPYIYVTSRAELGMAGQTKRPTSVVMIARDVVAKKGQEKKESEDGEDWSESFKGLVKVVEREGRHVKV